MGLAGPALVFLVFFALQSETPRLVDYTDRLQRLHLFSPILSLCPLS